MKEKLPGKKKSESGQIILVVLLVTVVILTIGLSVVSRSVTEVRISAQSQESARAFWAAQGGLENAIKARSSSLIEGNLGGVDYRVSKVGSSGLDYYIFPESIDATERVTFWLTNYNNPAQSYDCGVLNPCLTLYWGNSGQVADASAPALEATLIYKDNSVPPNYFSKKWTFDPYSGRNPATNFAATGSAGSLGTRNFAFTAEISDFPSSPDIPLLLDLKFFFNTSAQQLGVKVATGKTVFDQQDEYESVATVASSNITRKLREAVLWPRAPEIFDYLLFSGGNI